MLLKLLQKFQRLIQSNPRDIMEPPPYPIGTKQPQSKTIPYQTVFSSFHSTLSKEETTTGYSKVVQVRSAEKDKQLRIAMSNVHLLQTRLIA